MKKILVLLTLIVIMFTFTGCDSNKEYKNIEINVYDKDNNIIYNEEIKTEENKLFDVLTNIDDLDIKYENSEYGAFITSIKGIKQEDNYYWNYYVNSEYASVGISSCIVEDNAIYDFKLEKFE